MKEEPIHPDQNSYSSELIFEPVNQLILQLEQNSSGTPTEKYQEEPDQLHVDIAKAFTGLACYKKALIKLEKRISGQLDLPQAWIFRGHLLLYLKQYEAA